MPGDNSIVVSCACGKKLKAPASAAGKKARCPGCGATLILESNAAVPPAAPMRASAPAVARQPAASARPSTTRIASPAMVPAGRDDDGDGLDALNELAEQARSAPPSAPTSDDGELDLAPDPSDIPIATTRRPAGGTTTVAPVAPTTPVSAGGFARNGLLVIQDGATLPDRCIKCNAPAEGGRLKKRLAYNLDNSGPGAARLIPFVGRFVRLAWVIRQIMTRQHVTVSFCVCSKHRTMRLVGMIALAVALPAGALLVVNAAPKNDTALILTGVAVMAVGAILGATMTKLLSVASGLHNGAELRGAGKAFLASMPQPGTRRRVR